MTEKPNSNFRVNSIAGCADPNHPFNPTNGNTCEKCPAHSDVTCHDFPKKHQP